MAVAKVLIASGRLKCFSDGLNFFFTKSGCRCGRVGCVFVRKKDLTVEVTVNLGHVEVVHSVGMEQLFVRRCRMIPKFCQGILVSNAGRRVRGKGGQNMEQEAADAGKVAMDTDLAVVEYLQGNNKKLAVFACFHTFGDLDVFNIVVQTLEDGERPQFEVMAGIGCAVVDVVGVFAWIAEQLDIVTDGVFCHGRKPVAYRRWRFIFLLGKLRELFKKKSRHGAVTGKMR